jgi:Protein of unknown function (DUF2867)
MRVPREEFRRLGLEVHGILSDVPLHDVSAIDLPGGGAGRTISDVRSLIAGQNLRAVSPAVRALVALRTRAGRLFGWDSEIHTIRRHLDTSYIHRLSDDVKRRSALAPGSQDGRHHVLYVLEKESLTEFRNATVHGLFAIALIETLRGYRLYLGVYVQPVSRLTSLYMALIDPFRRFIVYPAVLRTIRKAWEARYAPPLTASS